MSKTNKNGKVLTEKQIRAIERMKLGRKKYLAEKAREKAEKKEKIKAEKKEARKQRKTVKMREFRNKKAEEEIEEELDSGGSGKAGTGYIDRRKVFYDKKLKGYRKKR